jgi:hypothetical protein
MPLGRSYSLESLAVLPSSFMISEITPAEREEIDAGLSVAAAAQDPSSFGPLGKEMARSQKIALSGLKIDKGLHSCGKIDGGDSGGGAGLGRARWPDQRAASTGSET